MSIYKKYVLHFDLSTYIHLIYTFDFNIHLFVQTEILLKRDSNTDVFWECCEIFKNTYFQEHLRTASSVLLIIKLVISTGHLPTSS